MRKLILIRHSISKVDPAKPAGEWALSAEGRQRCKPAAELLAPYRPGVVVTSREPKAAETGQLIAEALGLRCTTADGLHEHDRKGVGYLRTQEEFEQRVAHLFACPGQTVFGRESADEAHARFSRAVSDALAQYPGENVAIATHGTVMALFVARAAGLDPFEFWKQLTMPSLVVMRLPGFELEAVHTNSVGSGVARK